MPPDGVPLPTAMRRSSWSSDPFARGAFSFDAVGSTPRLARLARGARRRPALDRRRGVLPRRPGHPHRRPRLRAGCRRAGRSHRRARRARGRDRRGHGGTHRRGAPRRRGLRGRRRRGARSAWADACGRSTPTGSTGPSSSGPCSCPTTSRWSRPSAAASVDTAPFDGVVEARTAEGVAGRHPADRRRGRGRRAIWAEAATADVSLAAALVGSGTVPMPTVPGADGLSPAAWLAHAITSGVQPATGATTNRVSARTAPTDGVPGRVATRDRAARRPASTRSPTASTSRCRAW